MAFLEVKNVEIKGVAAAVPKQVKVAKEQPFFTDIEADNFTNVTGVISSHVAPADMTLSDLCQVAAEKLFEASGWERDSIDLIMFVSTSRDFYICPNTANILQDKLGLKTSIMALDLPFACSGYVYGLSVASSLMQSGQLKRALLCVGEMTSKNQSNLDKTVWALHGDAGSATFLEYNPEAKHPMQFNLGSDGSGWEAIICREVGVRYPTTPDSLVMKKYDEGIERNGMQCSMDGMSVFSFAITRPGKCIKELAEHFDFNLPDIDYLLIHNWILYCTRNKGYRILVEFINIHTNNLICITYNSQIGVMRYNNNLTFHLSRPYKFNQIFIHAFIVQILLRLINYQRLIIHIYE